MNIAVLIASTSNKTNWKEPTDALFFKHTIPSIEKLSSDKFNYKYFIGVDDDDEFFINNEADIKNNLSELNINFDFLFVENKNHKPCPVWNFLFEKAYDDGFDYFLQCGDDIDFLNAFDDDFVSYLNSKQNVALAGSTCDVNTSLVTQAFVHRSHMDIFGFLFPEELTDWGSDNWITEVYSIEDRCLKSEDHKILNANIVLPFENYSENTVNRYKVSLDSPRITPYAVNKHKEKIKNYLKSNRLKILTFYSDSHKNMHDNMFLPSVEVFCGDDVFVESHKFNQTCSSGEFMSDGFGEFVINKFDVLLNELEDLDDSIVVFSDCDVVIMSDIGEDIRSEMVGYDIKFQSDVSNVCTGFFAFRKNIKVRNLISASKNYAKSGRSIYDQDSLIYDQDALNHCIEFMDINYGILNVSKYNNVALSGFSDLWNVGDKFTVNPETIMFHANFTIGIKNKESLLEYVMKSMRLTLPCL